MTRRTQLLMLASAVVLSGCAVWGPERPPERNAALRLEQGLAALEQGLYREAFDELRWVYMQCAGHEAGHRALTALAAMELDPRNDRGRPAVGSDLLARVIRDPATPAWSRPLAETSYLLGLALGAPPMAQPGTANDSAAGAEDTVADDGSTATATTAAASTATADDSAEFHVMSVPPARVRAPGPVPVPRGTSDEAFACGRLLTASTARIHDLPVLPGPSLITILAESEAQRDALEGRADSLSARLAATRRELEETRSELERIRKTLKP